ncbi:MAG: hypothetical protein LBM04_06400 [Opitutaceae bacterium]|jgi:hypothetical protein|nr:hypothetical protein [Opitutaceae bacterium]
MPKSQKTKPASQAATGAVIGAATGAATKAATEAVTEAAISRSPDEAQPRPLAFGILAFGVLSFGILELWKFFPPLAAPPMTRNV